MYILRKLLSRVLSSAQYTGLFMVIKSEKWAKGHKQWPNQKVMRSNEKVMRKARSVHDKFI